MYINYWELTYVNHLFNRWSSFGVCSLRPRKTGRCRCIHPRAFQRCRWRPGENGGTDLGHGPFMLLLLNELHHSNKDVNMMWIWCEYDVNMMWIWCEYDIIYGTWIIMDSKKKYHFGIWYGIVDITWYYMIWSYLSPIFLTAGCSSFTLDYMMLEPAKRGLSHDAWNLRRQWRCFFFTV